MFMREGSRSSQNKFQLKVISLCLTMSVFVVGCSGGSETAGLSANSTEDSIVQSDVTKTSAPRTTSIGSGSSISANSTQSAPAKAASQETSSGDRKKQFMWVAGAIAGVFAIGVIAMLNQSKTEKEKKAKEEKNPVGRPEPLPESVQLESAPAVEEVTPTPNATDTSSEATETPVPTPPVEAPVTPVAQTQPMTAHMSSSPTFCFIGPKILPAPKPETSAILEKAAE